MFRFHAQTGWCAIPFSPGWCLLGRGPHTDSTSVDSIFTTRTEGVRDVAWRAVLPKGISSILASATLYQHRNLIRFPPNHPIVSYPPTSRCVGCAQSAELSFFFYQHGEKHVPFLARHNLDFFKRCPPYVCPALLTSLAVCSAVIGEFDEVEDAGKDLSRIKAEPLKPVTH